jgi:hypothetical protein
MMEAVRTSETSVDNHFTWQYNPEDSSEHHTRRRENLKSHMPYSSLLFLVAFHLLYTGTFWVMQGLTYANTTLRKLFHKAYNKIFEM